MENRTEVVQTARRCGRVSLLPVVAHVGVVVAN